MLAHNGFVRFAWMFGVQMVYRGLAVDSKSLVGRVVRGQGPYMPMPSYISVIFLPLGVVVRRNGVTDW